MNENNLTLSIRDLKNIKTQTIKMGNHEKIAKKIAVRIVSLLKKRSMAEFYINGCSHYLTYLDEEKAGFGSGQLEIIFGVNDTADEIERKLIDYFDYGYAPTISYDGCDSDKTTQKILKDHKWEDISQFYKITYRSYRCCKS